MGKAIKTVLIVDDDQNITRTFARILQKHGYETDIAQTGKIAIEKAKAKCYTAALIDICLPDINGIEILNKIDNHDCNMIKIVITGFPTTPPKTGKKADAYLLKPVRPQDLVALLNEKTKAN